MSERGPQVLFAMMTGTGIGEAEDGTMFVNRIANSLDASVDAKSRDGNAVMEFPFLVIIATGSHDLEVTVALEIEYPNGGRFPIGAKRLKEPAPVPHGVIPMVFGVGFQFRAPGVHWIRVLINDELKTESPINVRQSVDEVATGVAMRADFQA